MIKKFFLLSLLLLITACYGTENTQITQTEATQKPPTQEITEEEVATEAEDKIDTMDFPDWEDRDALAFGLIASEQHRIAEMQNAPIYHLDLNIAEDMQHITGTAEILYSNQEDTALNELYFHLLPNYLGEAIYITEVAVNGEKVIFFLELEDTVMRVPLNTALEIGENLVIKIEFETIVPTEIESNYGILAYSENVLALAHAYPMLSVYDDEGWNIEIPNEQGDVTYLDAAMYVVRVNAPKGLVIAASGRELKQKSEGDRQIILYVAAPARDFYLAASADYLRIQKKVGEYTINSYAPKTAAEGSGFALNVAADAIALFSEKYAPYPYTEFDIVSTPTYALGIEYPGMTAVNIEIYDFESVNKVYLESTVAHEAGHQWFYNLVGNDQLDEPWLDESLTQYITWQYYGEKYGDEGLVGFGDSLNNRWGRVDFGEVPLGMPVSAYEGSEYGAIIYGRGAFFFEALREEMGGEVFDAFMKDYTQTHLWKIASTESLREAAEAHCRCDLSDLFAAWVYEE